MSFVFCAGTSFSYGYLQHNISSDSMIEWKSSRLLKESDFRAKTKIIEGCEASSSVSVVFLSDTISKSRYRFVIKACFFPFRSWSIPSMGMLLLQHEQFHFNIAELVARKMRACIRGVEIDNSNFDNLVSELDNIRKEFEELNKKYDNETSHGLLKVVQFQWQKKIAEQLNELKEYELKDGIELYKYRDLIQQKPSADSVKEWHGKKLLKWSDFKSENPPSASFGAGSTTNVIFTCDTLPNRKYKLNIKAYFFPYESRHNNGSSLLLHEQVHFNIAELVARKMRASIRGIEIDNSNIDSLVWKILSVKSELDVLHKKHDKETANGKVTERQSEWQKRIEKQLAELKDYELRNGIELYRHTKKDK